MRAAVLTEINKPLQILDLEQEPPKANEVRVQVKAAGVCMSDWHIMNGDWPMPLPMDTRPPASWSRTGDRGQAGRSCDLLVPAALRPVPLLLVRPHRPVRRP